MSDRLTEELLAKPVGPTIPARAAQAGDFTRKVEIRGNTAELEVRADAGTVNEGTGLLYLEEEGLNPDEWEATHFRKIKYGQGMESVKFSYKRRAFVGADRPNLEELFELAVNTKTEPGLPAFGQDGLIVALGDMQFGKIDGDGVEGTLRRVIDCLDAAAEQAGSTYPEHIHIAWLGDHVEGFNSQGGANVWRTVLTMNEQIRLTRRVMMHALQRFAPLAPKVSMAAVPGNHGEPQRIAGKGVTRYDDSHDTESLIAVHEAAKLNPEAFGHVEFYVPHTDELTVVTEVAGTYVAHAHGHQWRGGKHFEWWRAQAFHNPGLNQAGLLLAGHLHHFHVDSDGPRRFVQVPSFESESTWFRHTAGSTGNPGLVMAHTRDNITNRLEVIQ